MTVRKYFKRVGGFTLVELLIVIAILAIIALIVIAAINPIEQANRAKDTGKKADGSQLVSAIDRYFAARYEYPWVAQEVTTDNDAAFGFVTAGDGSVGICGYTAPDTDCEADGILITTSELKTEFRNRDFIDAYVETGGALWDVEYLMVGKANLSDSTYVCYIPASNANRDRACDEAMGYTLTAGGEREPIDPALCGVDDYPWVGDALTNSFYVCVPE